MPTNDILAAAFTKINYQVQFDCYVRKKSQSFEKWVRPKY